MVTSTRRLTAAAALSVPLVSVVTTSAGADGGRRTNHCTHPAGADLNQVFTTGTLGDGTSSSPTPPACTR